MQCNKDPYPPVSEPLNVYQNTLMSGFDIGIDDSKQNRGWLSLKEGYYELKYPADLDWGCVFIVTGLVPLDSVCEDFSNYKGFTVDLRGTNKGNSIGISIEGCGRKSSYEAVIADLNSSWQTYKFSFKSFPDINISRLRTVLKIRFTGKDSVTTDFRNLRFYSTYTPDTNTYEYYLIQDNNLMNHDSMGCNTIDSIHEWIHNDGQDWALSFPPDQLWATAFLKNTDGVDLSGYGSLIFNIKGEEGGEVVQIGINDTIGEDPSGRSFVQWTISRNWEQVDVPLKWFKDVNMSRIYIPFQIVIFNTTDQIVHFKNIRFRTDNQLH